MTNNTKAESQLGEKKHPSDCRSYKAFPKLNKKLVQVTCHICGSRDPLLSARYRWLVVKEHIYKLQPGVYCVGWINAYWWVVIICSKGWSRRALMGVRFFWNCIRRLRARNQKQSKILYLHFFIFVLISLFFQSIRYFSEAVIFVLFTTIF